MEEQGGFKVSGKRRTGDILDESWEDGGVMLGGYKWPPTSYSCSFCKREFKSAQALGGHMNVHRRDRANKLNNQKSGFDDFRNPNSSHQYQFDQGKKNYFVQNQPKKSSCLSMSLVVHGHNTSSTVGEEEGALDFYKRRRLTEDGKVVDRHHKFEINGFKSCSTEVGLDLDLELRLGDRP